MTHAIRYAVFLVEPDITRFNACFSEQAKAVTEAAWYVRHGYRVIVARVPDDLRRYTLPTQVEAWIRSYGITVGAVRA